MTCLWEGAPRKLHLDSFSCPDRGLSHIESSRNCNVDRCVSKQVEEQGKKVGLIRLFFPGCQVGYTFVSWKALEKKRHSPEQWEAAGLSQVLRVSVLQHCCSLSFSHFALREAGLPS